MKKWLLRIGIGLAVLLVAVVLARNWILRAALSAGVESATGFPLEIGKFDLGLFSSRLEVDRMRLLNPPGFEDPRCLDVPRLVLDVELTTMLGNRPHVQDLVLHVAEVVVVKNAKGETNLDRLKALTEKEEGGKEGAKPGGGGKSADRKGDSSPEKRKKVRIDHLDLRVGKVRFLDYSRARDGKPREDTWDLDLHLERRDIDDPKKVVRMLVLEVLKATPIKLAGATIETLASGLGGVADGAGRALEGAAGALGQGVKGVGEGIEKGLGGILGGGEEKKRGGKKK